VSIPLTNVSVRRPIGPDVPVFGFVSRILASASDPGGRMTQLGCVVERSARSSRRCTGRARVVDANRSCAIDNLLRPVDRRPSPAGPPSQGRQRTRSLSPAHRRRQPAHCNQFIDHRTPAWARNRRCDRTPKAPSRTAEIGTARNPGFSLHTRHCLHCHADRSATRPRLKA
jgi:hypothetical protein